MIVFVVLMINPFGNYSQHFHNNAKGALGGWSTPKLYASVCLGICSGIIEWFVII